MLDPPVAVSLNLVLLWLVSLMIIVGLSVIVWVFRIV